jgi:acyl-CoA reductase-like NAD-dependent aldehyde dehydrogenase
MASGLPKPISNPEFKYTQLLINNEFVNSVSGKTFPTINPATGEKIVDIQEADKEDVEKAVAAAKAAFKRGSAYRKMNASERGVLLNKLADLLSRDLVTLATLCTLDNGKPFVNSFGEIRTAIGTLRYFGGMADKIVGQTIPVDGNAFCYTRHEPVGVIGAITPWNFPGFVELLKIGPAIAAGCTMILKPAEQTPLVALHIAAMVVEAGFPPGVINVLPGYGPTAGAAIVNHHDVDKVAFTGSTEVGQLILERAAKTNLKRVTLELGGKSPFIIFPDVDLKSAVETAHNGIMYNMGQVCCAGSRTFVHESIYDEFVRLSAERALKKTTGDPFDPKNENGAQIDDEQMTKIMELIESGKTQGARLVCGGKRLGDKGYFVEPTVFADVTGNMRIAKEEIFGPVQSILKFKDVDDAIDQANDTTYGLGAGILTNDLNTALVVSSNIRAGTVWVNTYGDFAIQMPFGGYKMSGQGRENGLYGVEAYLEVKTVFIRTPEKL